MSVDVRVLLQSLTLTRSYSNISYRVFGHLTKLLLSGSLYSRMKCADVTKGKYEMDGWMNEGHSDISLKKLHEGMSNVSTARV